MKENKVHIISSNMAHLLSESDLAKVSTREELLDLLEGFKNKSYSVKEMEILFENWKVRQQRQKGIGAELQRH